MKSHSISMPGKRNQAGFLMIEVLITIVILALGLLGLAGLQAKIQTSETESFQRTQALLLLQDMVNRISANRLNAASYLTSTTCANSGACLGTSPPTSCSGLTGAALDLCEWDHALKGAGEKAAGSGASIGAMVGARGCVELVSGSNPPLYRVSVAWQGMSQLKVPSLACGQTSYGGESYRRVIAGTVSVPNLIN